MVAAACALVMIAARAGASPAPPGSGGEDPPPPTYADIAPVLAKHCTSCHNRENRRDQDAGGGLVLDSYRAILRSGAAVRGRSARSKLILRLRHEDPAERMPPDGPPLPADVIAKIARWIDAGLPEGRPALEAALPPPGEPPPRVEIVLRAETAVPAGLEFRVPVPPPVPVTALAFAPESLELAAGTDGLVTLWHLEEARPLWHSQALPGKVHDLAFAPQGGRLAAAGGLPALGGRLVIFELGEGPPRVREAAKSADAAVAVSWAPAGDRLAFADADGTVRVLDTQAFAEVAEFEPHSGTAADIAFYTEKDALRLLTCGSDGTLKCFEPGKTKPLASLGGHTGEVLALDVRPGALEVLSGSSTGEVFLWDLARRARKSTLRAADRTRIEDVAYSADGRLLAYGGEQGTVEVREAGGSRTGTAAAGAWIHSVAWGGPHLLAVGSSDGFVRLWRSGGERAELRPVAVLGSWPAGGGREEPAEWIILAATGHFSGSTAALEAAECRIHGIPTAPPALYAALDARKVLGTLLEGGEAAPAVGPPQRF